MDDPKVDPARHGVLMRAAVRIADLGNPFYDEERQRDVWNEASAVGFQVMLWAGFVTAAVLAWLPGGAGAPFALVVLGLVGIGALTTLAYSESHKVDDFGEAAAGRVLAAAVPLLAIAGGLFRWWVWPGDRDGFWGGFRMGVAFAMAALAVVLVVLSLVQVVRRR